MRVSVPLRTSLLALVLSGLALTAGCDNSFSPKAAYKERIVVYGILDRSAPYQLVRLETTYDAEGTTPDVPIGKRTIDTAKVIIANDIRAWILNDTIITGSDGVRRKVWISRAFRPEEAKNYRLIVETPGLPQITATTLVPAKAYIQLSGPEPGSSSKGVLVRAGVISDVAPPKGYYFRLWVVGKKVGTGEPVRREVPIRYDASTGQPVWPTPSRISSVTFSVDAVQAVKGALEGQDGGTNIELVATAYTMDSYLYSYFQTVRGFDDPVSVRQDRPDVSNINGGVGVFGALVTDSVRAAYASVISGL